ncbi:HTH-type transcriptional regulator CymR [Roseimaritima multifibrata]|uniref:HTH-type transcriptional regulator CymR n=1 Tax=Roseimaritima multifibrata TaxID=1930274 RepID=A0A517MH12_9BACT|nr:Rrf2 family transcriptional regulator [Roseimaritima multifibrata]QDS94171.1 HTH-type transcriptional regulator CymR [Roseimaritima multifibrata]
MQIPARVHYGCLAMLDMASHANRSKPVALREITKRQGIPQPFLVQILQQLKGAGWVSSTRGAQGGYRLLVEPESLTLLDIVQQIGCGDGGCGGDDDATRESQVLRAIWEEASDAFRDKLAKTRLSDLATRCDEPAESMFYI